MEEVHKYEYIYNKLPKDYNDKCIRFSTWRAIHEICPLVEGRHFVEFGAKMIVLRLRPWSRALLIADNRGNCMKTSFKFSRLRNERSGFEPWPETFCLWASHFTLTLLSRCLSPPRCINGWVTLRCTSLPSRGEEVFLVASCYWNRDKHRPDETLGSYADLTFFTNLKASSLLRRHLRTHFLSTVRTTIHTNPSKKDFLKAFFKPEEGHSYILIGCIFLWHGMENWLEPP